MSTFWIKTIQLILSLTILVVFHEFGHFLFSRLFGVRVEKFYAFFNPRFSLVRIKRVDGKIRVKFFLAQILFRIIFYQHPGKIHAPAFIIRA